jgi:hypothetical protein
VRPIDNRGYQYDKKWVINNKQNAVMNGNKIGVLGGINIIFMVIKLSFWAQALRPYDILQVASRCAKKENFSNLPLSPSKGRCPCLLPSNKKVRSP